MQIEDWDDFIRWRGVRHPDRYDTAALAEEYEMDIASGAWPTEPARPTRGEHALRLCLPLLRADLCGIIDSNTAWTLAALGKPAECLPAKLDCIRAAVSTDLGAEELCEEIAPYLAAIRAAEAVVGRIQAAHDPAWLDRVIDGEAGV